MCLTWILLRLRYTSEVMQSESYRWLSTQYLHYRVFSHFSLKLECEKLATEKTEMQRHYVMVSFSSSDNLQRQKLQ